MRAAVAWIKVAALVAWIAWRCWTLATMPSMPDPREGLLIEDIHRVQEGESPELFHWPGTPWTFLVAGASSALRLTEPVSVARLMRFATLGFAVVCLLLTYAIARRVTRFPLLAPLILAASPAFSTGEANVGLVDFPALAFGQAGIWVALSGKRPILVGALIGFGAAFKLPTVLCLAPAMTLIALDSQTLRAKATAGVALIAGAAAGFLIGCPYILREAGTVWAGLSYELEHYGAGHFGLIPTTNDHALSAAFRHAATVGWATGPLLAMTAVAAVAFVCSKWRERDRERVALIMWFVVAIFAISVHRFSFVRHWLIALPAVALLMSIALGQLRGRARRVVAVGLGVALVHSTLMTAAIDLSTRSPSTIERCEAWLSENAGGKTISWGPSSPVFAWLYPSGCEDAEDADIIVVAAAESALQRAIHAAPDAYRDTDFFPLNREHFTAGAFHEQLAAPANDMTVAQFNAPFPRWANFVFLGRRPPFPLNALFHPKLIVYQGR